MIYYQDDLVTIYHADCREILPQLSGISAVVTDPPYELGFMSKQWDGTGISFQMATWRLIREACLPGAMLLSFGGTRTSHRIACAIEDAGWQIRDTIMYVFGSGFPKSLDISKAIDKGKGIWMEKWVKEISKNESMSAPNYERTPKGEPSFPEAKLWEGYGTALKPAYEPIIIAMNPLDGTFADNALKHKVAGLNIDATRIPLNGDKPRNQDVEESHTNTYGWAKGGIYKSGQMPAKGRFSSNFIHDGSQEVMELFPDSKTHGGGEGRYGGSFGGNKHQVIGRKTMARFQGDSGSAARFFYCAKASRSERDAGLEDMPLVKWWGKGTVKFSERQIDYRQNKEYTNHPTRNYHPTVKPLALMTYLCKLIKMPEYNLILDPFCGSGSTLLTCKRLGIPCIGIDSNEEYCEIAAKRLHSLT